VPLCYAAFISRLLGLHQPTIVFVESFCRVQSLSLTGRLLYPIVDKFVVQWPQLCEKYGRAEHLGVIC
jgi:beta-1,4-N-acetylglucosaminyltransferase